MAATATALYGLADRLRVTWAQEARQLEATALRRVVESGIALLLAAHRPGTPEPTIVPPDRYANLLARVGLHCAPWGLYDLCWAQAVSLDGLDTFRREYLLGAGDPARAPVLTVVNEGDLIDVGGTTAIRGLVRVPGGRFGIYGGGDLPPGTHDLTAARTTPPPQRLPALATERIGGLLASRPTVLEAHEAAADVLAGRVVQIDPLRLTGRTLVVATDRIEVSAGNLPVDLLLVAPHITLRSGLRGRVQAIASDSLYVGAAVSLTEGSGLVLRNPTRRLHLPETASVAGAIVDMEGERGVGVALSAGSRVRGVVYTPRGAVLDGEVAGMVFAQQIATTVDGVARPRLLGRARLRGDTLGAVRPSVLSFGGGERPSSNYRIY